MPACGWQALGRARQAQRLHAAPGGVGLGRGAALTQAAAFTLLDPHVYMDTVLLVGSVGAQQPPGLRGRFIGGAACGCAMWFGALGYGARRLAPWFARARAWQCLVSLTGVAMLVLDMVLLAGHATAP